MSLDRLVPALRGDLHEKLFSLVENLLNDPELPGKIENLISKAKSRTGNESELRVRDILTPEIIDLITDLPESYAPLILKEFKEKLTDGNVENLKNTLKSKAEALVNAELSHYSKLETLIKIVYPKLPNEIVEGLVERHYETIIQYIDDPELSEKLSQGLEEKLTKVLDSSAGDFLSGLLKLIPDEGGNRIIAFLQNIGKNRIVVDWLNNTVQSLEKKIWEIEFGSLLPWSSDQVVEKAVLQLSNLIKGNQFDSAVKGLLDAAMNKKIGKLCFLANESDIQNFCEIATHRWLFPMVTENVEKILEQLRVDKMAETQINNLNLDDLQSMITDVVNREFQTINMLGAILGGAIGFATEILAR